MSPTDVPESGWYPDPRGTAHRYRWWDGGRWTAQLSEDPGAAPPAVVPAAEPAATTASTPSTPSTLPTRKLPAGARPVRIDPARTSAYRRPPRTAHRAVRPDRVVAAVALAVVLVAVSLVVVLRSDGAAQSAPLLAPSSPTPSRAVVVYDPATRRAEVADVVATFPVSPFTNQVVPPGTPPGLFAAAVIAQAPVHPAYDGTDDWSATIFLGALDAGVVRPGDGSETAKAVFAVVRRTFYAGVETSYAAPRMTSTVAGRGRRVIGLQTDLRYAVPRLASSYDRVTILVVEPPSGSSEPPVAWVSARPGDSSAATTRALQDALDTLNLA